MNKILALGAALLLIAACGGESTPAPEAAAVDAAPAEAAPVSTAPEVPDFGAILAAQPEEVKARYQYRNPAETMAFFGIEPGMTVVEALPGGGWYSKLLLPYLGADGQLIGADYPMELFGNFGWDEARVAAKATWVEDWTADAESWRGDGDAAVAAFQMGALPESMHGTADAVLYIRALQNLARFQDDGGYLTASLTDMYNVLKPGGVVGVVQHHARDDMPDEWANGNNGYLKSGFLIAAMESAGFEYVDSTDINANPNDQPTAEDFVWRLPPSLNGAADNPEREAEMRAIGESNRMTLKFRKPTA